jgi:DNA-binding transcriptional regulator YiaG
MFLLRSDACLFVVHATSARRVIASLHIKGLIDFILMRSGAAVNRISINLMGRSLITTRQVKAARALLGWSQADLARRSGISVPTIARLESAEGELGGREGTGEKIKKAIVSAGIEFISENGGGPGVRLRKRQQKRS